MLLIENDFVKNCYDHTPFTLDCFMFFVNKWLCQEHYFEVTKHILQLSLFFLQFGKSIILTTFRMKSISYAYSSVWFPILCFSKTVFYIPFWLHKGNDQYIAIF